MSRAWAHRRPRGAAEGHHVLRLPGRWPVLVARRLGACHALAASGSDFPELRASPALTKLPSATRLADDLRRDQLPRAPPLTTKAPSSGVGLRMTPAPRSGMLLPRGPQAPVEGVQPFRLVEPEMGRELPDLAGLRRKR